MKTVKFSNENESSILNRMFVWFKKLKIFYIHLYFFAVVGAIGKAKNKYMYKIFIYENIYISKQAFTSNVIVRRFW